MIPDAINGKPLFLLPPEFAEAPRPTSNSRIEGTRLGQAPNQYKIFDKRPLLMLQQKYTCLNPAEVDALLDRLITARGAFRSFWVPSWVSEFVPGSVQDGVWAPTGVVQGSTQIVADADVSWRSPAAVFVYYLDVNELHISKVASVEGAAINLPDGREWINGQWSQGLPYTAAANRVICGFMYLVRLAADSVALEFAVPGAVMTATLSLMEDPGFAITPNIGQIIFP